MEFLHDASQDSDGGFLLAGHSFSIPDTNRGEYWGYIVKTDSAGNMLWDWHAYDEDTSAGYSTFNKIIPTSDGGCLATGFRYESSFDTTIFFEGAWQTFRFAVSPNYVVKLDSSGHLMWEKLLPGRFSDSFSGVVENASGYLVASSTAIKPYGLRLYQINFNGDTLWTKDIYDPNYGFGDRIISVIDLLPTPDGNYWAVFGDRILKVTPTGDLLWTKLQEMAVRNVRPIPGGGWAMVHSTKFSTLDDNGDIMMSVDLANRFATSTDLISINDAMPTPDGGFAVLASAWSGIHLFKTDCAGRIENAQLCSYTATDPVPSAALQAAPNPARDQLRVLLAGGQAGTQQLRIADLSGKTVYTAEVQAVAGIAQWQVPVGGLAAGMYLLSVTGSSGAMQTVFMKE